MPIREYSCCKCGHVFEEFYKPGETEPELMQCPHCETLTAEKIFSVTGGYSGDLGSASVRPKGAGSRPRRNK
jgi:putative FmdB family regulatory protein